ncbi:cupin domain-containing protein [Chloroflexota bacterium]
MKVIRMNEVEAEEATESIFKGKVNRQELVTSDFAKELRANLIMLAPGARNVFHTHTCEQILYVTEGKGIVATEQEEKIVTPGMIIFFPTGESHWHGATKDSSFAYITITIMGHETNY